MWNLDVWLPWAVKRWDREEKYFHLYLLKFLAFCQKTHIPLQVIIPAPWVIWVCQGLARWSNRDTLKP